MSEAKLISPLLDNFIMGDPFSDHSGIQCCPAMEKDSDSKYIVKIISLPASQTQLDALLLTGALKSDEAAKEYFEARANDLIREIEVLQQLSRQEGFLPFKGYQAVPAEDSVGTDVYILSEYRRSLERQFTKKPLTQLDALNLGLDLCSALNACRRSGYLFINLKPSNVYVTQNREYKISDIGFVSLKALKYATLPQHYIGSYTPPELTDPFCALNETIDIYALGMILYSVYNGGTLPEITDQELPAPAYADEELSQIILKACSKNMDDRWQDPAQMGQALINYMQKNGASDTPIVPVPEPEEEPVQNEESVADEPGSEEIEETLSDESCEAIPEEVISEEVEEEIDADALSPKEAPLQEEPSEETSDEAAHPPSAPQEESSDEEVPEEVSYDELTDEVSQILSQADELAAMDVPEPVVAPEPVEVVLPPSEEEPVEEPVPEEQPDSEETSEEEPAQSAETEEGYEYFEEYPIVKSHWLRNTLLIISGICLLVGGFLFYKLYFMKTIDDLYVDGNRNTITVYVTSEADESLLSISCTDLYGKTVIVPVVDGKAEFSGLLANAEYTIDVIVKGFHAVNGETTANYFTPAETAIVQYNVVTGTIPGTAILSFTVSGPDSEQWSFTYGAAGQEKKTATFSGHTLTLTDLEEDMVYTGVLEPEDDLFIPQTTEISFTASEVIQANNLMITSCADGKLTAQWSVPESVEVDGWIVRCYNGSDYDQTVNTTDTFVEFTDLDHTDSFTVDVTAAGQSFIQTATVGENSVTVKELSADCSTPGKISLSWNASSVPAGGWIISYTVDGSDLVMSTTSGENQAVIEPAIPDAQYVFTVRAADSSPTVCQPYTCQTEPAQDFSVNYAGNVVTKDNLRFYLCRRPETSDWSHNDLADSDYTSTFWIGEKAGYVVFLNRKYDLSYETITTAFVIRDENENVVSISSVAESWTAMWYKNYCELNIPSLPEVPGQYTISVYFNGQFAVKQSFTLNEQ